MFTGIAGFKRESESRALPFSLSCVQSSCVKRQSAESSQSGDKGRGWVTLLLQCGVNCEQRGVWVCSLCPAPCWAHGNRSWCGDGECWGYGRAVCRVGTGIAVEMEALLSAGSWLCFPVLFHAHGYTGTKILPCELSFSWSSRCSSSTAFPFACSWEYSALLSQISWLQERRTSGKMYHQSRRS